MKQHVDLLKDGGRLLIVIPNLRGANELLARFFSPEIIPLHNRKIMNNRDFPKLFDDIGLRPLFEGYLGVFSFRLQHESPGSWKWYVKWLGYRLGQICDVLLLTVLRGRHPESKWLSPYLVYVGEVQRPSR